MSGMWRYVRRVRELPPREAVRRAAELVSFRVRRRWRRWVDQVRPDPSGERRFVRRLGVESGEPRPELLSDETGVFPVCWTPVQADSADLEALRALAGAALEHRFDLLGSGSIQVDYELKAAGLEGHQYAMAPGPGTAVAQRVRMEALLSGSADGYDPIDWQLDFKSGYRWSERIWSMDLSYGRLPGVDVKVPWELSRFQHLGPLGLLARLEPGTKTSRVAGREFVAQIVDWIAANPVRRGINWSCTMEVAIRAVNWLVALELFRDDPAVTPRFRWLLARSLYAHGLHIQEHLEYSPRAGGNHYLSNVVGLLCIAAALPEVPESDRWLAWSLQELVSEMGRQVLPDGVDHEGSSGYHFLVAEMLYLGTLVGLRARESRRERLAAVRAHRVPHPRAPRYRGPGPLRFDHPALFPDWYLDRLLGMAEFGAALAGPSGRVPLYGDHDSGRLFRIAPSGGVAADAPFREDFRERGWLYATAAALFACRDLDRSGAGARIESALLAGDLELGPVAEAVQTLRRTEKGVPAQVVRPAPGVALYPHGGIAVVRDGPMHLVIIFAAITPGASGGHFHNDLLSFEFSWEGTNVVVDPGTYLYTPAPALRDRYRSVCFHNTVAVDGLEQRLWPEAADRLFTVLRDAEVEVLELAAGVVRARCCYEGVTHERCWRWDGDHLTVEDQLSGADRATLIHMLAPGVEPEAEPESVPEHGAGGYRISLAGPVRAELQLEGVRPPIAEPAALAPGYGQRVDSVRLVAGVAGDRCVSRIRVFPSQSTD